MIRDDNPTETTMIPRRAFLKALAGIALAGIAVAKPKSTTPPTAVAKPKSTTPPTAVAKPKSTAVADLVTLRSQQLLHRQNVLEERLSWMLLTTG